MKCPKCGYLGFETGDRCRNCGYDFSLAPPPRSSADLSLRGTEVVEAPLADFDLEGLDTAARDEAPVGLDFDRLIGEPEPDANAGAPAVSEPAPTVVPPARGRRTAPAPAPVAARRRTPPPADEPAGRLESVGAAEPAAPGRPPEAPVEEEPRLPFLGGATDDDTPLITSPRPLRAPLAVRRATPEVPRARTRTTRPIRREEPTLALALEPEGDAPPVDPALAARAGDWARLFEPAPRASRLLAAAVDITVLGGIGLAVLYLTLRLLGLTLADWRALPLFPLVAFLLLLDGGYLTAFTAAGGQTIGKMTTGIRVIGDDGRAVDAAGAVLRAVGCGLSLVTLGLGFLPAVVSKDGRALQDRLAGTRVISERG
ncbi:MAG: RDD family protein [Vicinamibacterales bacterium]